MSQMESIKQFQTISSEIRIESIKKELSQLESIKPNKSHKQKTNHLTFSHKIKNHLNKIKLF